MTTTTVAGFGDDRLAILRALRDRLAETIDATESARDLPPLARRLSDTLAEIAELEAGRVDQPVETPLDRIRRARAEAGRPGARPDASARGLIDRDSAA